MRSEREQIFYDIYKHHLWGGISKSGTGSDLGQTKVIRKELPKLLNTLSVQSMLDIPCGDMHWIKAIEWDRDIKYIGADIVPALIHANRELFPLNEFWVLDIVTDKLPQADLVLARDLFGHLQDHEVEAALRNIKQSGAKYLIATTFPAVVDNKPIKTGQWRPINMELFDVGMPITHIDEKLMTPDNKNMGKFLGVYKLS